MIPLEALHELSLFVRLRARCLLQRGEAALQLVSLAQQQAALRVLALQLTLQHYNTYKYNMDGKHVYCIPLGETCHKCMNNITYRESKRCKQPDRERLSSIRPVLTRG